MPHDSGKVLQTKILRKKLFEFVLVHIALARHEVVEVSFK
jgi:hypothetical protein